MRDYCAHQNPVERCQICMEEARQEEMNAYGKRPAMESPRSNGKYAAVLQDMGQGTKPPRRSWQRLKLGGR